MGVHGDEVTSQPLDPGPARLTAWPVVPQEWMRNRWAWGRVILVQRGRRWTSLVCRLGQGMQHRAHTTGFFGGGTMSLTLRTQRARATVGNAGGGEHTQRSIVFRATFLLVKSGPLRTAQCAIGLQGKVLSSQASHTSRAGPLWGPESGFFS